MSTASPLWLPGFTIEPGNSSGTWAPDNTDAPRIVLHTTEGSTAAGAFAAFTRNNSWPHLTVDPLRRTRYQHVPLDAPARALRNSSAPGETNRDARVYQVEIVGFAVSMRHLSDEAADWLGAQVLAPLAAATGCPLTTTVTFYDQAAGFTLAATDARQRLSAADWDTYRGVLGHQHVPENTHWDPGAIPIARILTAARKETPTVPEPDFEARVIASLTRIERSLGYIAALALAAKNEAAAAGLRAQANQDQLATLIERG